MRSASESHFEKQLKKQNYGVHSLADIITSKRFPYTVFDYNILNSVKRAVYIPTPLIISLINPQKLFAAEHIKRPILCSSLSLSYTRQKLFCVYLIKKIRNRMCPRFFFLL